MVSKRAQSKAGDKAGAAAKARQDLEEARRSSAAHGPLVFSSVLSQQRKADGSIDVRLEDQDWYRTYTVDVNVPDPLPWKSTIAVLAWNEPFNGHPGVLTGIDYDDESRAFDMEAEGEGWAASWAIPQGQWIIPAVGSPVSLGVTPKPAASHREKTTSRVTDEELAALVATISVEQSEAQIVAGDLGEPMATSGFRDLAGNVARDVLADALVAEGFYDGEIDAPYVDDLAPLAAVDLLAALAAAGLAVVPDGQVQLGGQRLEIIASDYGTLDRIAKLAKAAGSITVRMLPVDGPK